MDAHLRLGDEAFLVAWNPDKQRISGRSGHANLVMAAVLAELWLDGEIRDAGGKVTLAPAPSRTAAHDAVHQGVLRRIQQSKPRSWKYWIDHDISGTYLGIRNRLERRLILRTEPRSLLGLRWTKVAVREVQPGRDAVARCRAAVRDGGIPADSVAVRVATLTALVAAAELNTVLTGKERRTHRKRIAEFAARGGPATKALRDVVAGKAAAAA